MQSGKHNNVIVSMSRFARLVAVVVLGSGAVVSIGCATLAKSVPNSEGKLATTFAANELATHQAQLMATAAEQAERQGKTDEAVRLYEQAQALDPQQTQLSRRIAVLRDQQQEDDSALAAYDRALAQAPNDADLLNDRGVFHLRRNQAAQAEAWFRRALAAQPSHIRAQNNLAHALAMQDRLPEAFTVASQAVGPAAAYNNLGVILMRRGRNDEARDHFRRALECDPALNSAAALLAELSTPTPTTVASVQQ